MSPCSSRADVEEELRKVQDLANAGESIQLNIPADPGVLKTAVAGFSFLQTDVLIRIKMWCLFLNDLKKQFLTSDIRNYFNRIHDYDEIIKEISRRLSDDGQIRDDASQHLHEIRTKTRRLHRQIHETLASMLTERQNMFTDTTVVERMGHYVLPVKPNFKKDIPGIVHAYSNSGETVFIEPLQIADHAGQITGLAAAEQQEIEVILSRLTQVIKGRVDDIEQDIEYLVELDLLNARVRYAAALDATMPMFSTRLRIVNGYHPLLKMADHAVPLNLDMAGEKPVLLISGPNAGGKTVVLKTVGLIALMAKYGMFIPVDEGSEIPFYDEVYADIGDEQSIETHVSTFAGHVAQIKVALEGRENSLILLDELMSQTSVEEGSALAAAVLEGFARKKSTVLATTHNEELKLYVSKKDNMLNAGMEYTDRPTYRLILGIPQPSNALRLARQLGIREDILQHALSLMDQDKVSVNKMFEDLSKELSAVQEERDKLKRLMHDYESRLASLDSRKKKELAELRQKYRDHLIKAKRSIEKMIKDFKEKGPKPDRVHEMRKFFNEKLEHDTERVPYFPSQGELVKIRDLRKVGQVVEEHGGKYKVSLENIFYWVLPSDIESLQHEKSQGAG
jgi:DNA mismatch repair protein MutS2